MSLGCEAERQQRATVEASLETDHRGSLRVGARELHRVLDGLRAGIEERRLRRACDRRGRQEALRERDIRLVGNDREVGVEELRGLFLHCVDAARMRVTDVEAAASPCE